MYKNKTQEKYFKTEKGKKTVQRAVSKYFKKKRLEVMDILGGRKCVKCGFTDVRALQLDHINGGGNKENKKIGKYLMYAKNPDLAKKILQVLCANCNWIKRVENKEEGQRLK